MMTFRNITFTLLFMAGFAASVQSQNWDYPTYPQLDAQIRHLDGEIRISEEGHIQGDVLYTVRFLRQRTDTLRLHSSGINIVSVSVEGESADYRMNDDRLLISLEQEFSRNDQARVRIQYDTRPSFGLHRNGNGTLWTSLLPKTTRHWLPVTDHPRAAFTTELIFTYPSGFSMVASGRGSSSDVVSVERESTTFTSDIPVPASALAWSTGNFTRVGSVTPSGSGPQGSAPRISVYGESEYNYNGEEDLLSVATSAFENMQNETGRDFPYSDLNIVILDDDYWETKNYGAGVVFAYLNRGNLVRQIEEGILAQWAGVYVREEQWSDADAIHALQGFLARRWIEAEAEHRTEDGTAPYDVFSLPKVDQWGEFLNGPESAGFTTDLELTIPAIFSEEHRVLAWEDFSGLIYDQTGMPYFDGFTLPAVQPGEDPERDPGYVYTASVEWEEGSNTIELYFEAAGQPVEELVSVQVEEVGFSGQRTHEAAFSGDQDGVAIQVSPAIENLKLTVEERDDIVIHEEKPFMFWIYQLRNDENVKRRAEAARALSRSENPDLQLALSDVLEMESNPEVYAEILRSMAVITAGASGTEERFLDHTSSRQPSVIQKAAVEGLAYYRGNDRVINRLQNIILQSDNDDIQREAIRSLFEVTDAGQFRSYVESLVTRESVLDEVPTLLQMLARKGEAEIAVDIATDFIAAEFPYSTRSGVLDVLLEYDQSPENWYQRLPELLEDPHPRIRYRAARATEKLGSQQRREVVTDRLDEEFDERIRRALQP